MTTQSQGSALDENAALALDTILQKPTRGIPTAWINLMEHAQIERLAGTEPGSYRRDPDRVYLGMQKAFGVGLLDQWIPDNPLSIGSHGYEHGAKTATQGIDRIVMDGMAIDSPEDVIEHLERIDFPRLRQMIAGFDENARVAQILEGERRIQSLLGPSILKTGYGFVPFPGFYYGGYGYVNYFMAYALYPEVMERHFALQADLALLKNRAAARACREGKLPPLYRLDHDMADSRGTLVDVRSLDKIWFPHFARCIEPLLRGGVKLIWHCDGNLMEMVPRLLEAGISGFQGFQYEDGMDYERICKMRTREGADLLIWGGVSVTTTLPLGTAKDVRDQLAWLVRYGPRTGLILGCSSSATPGVPWENVQALVEGLRYYRTHGRG